MSRSFFREIHLDYKQWENIPAEAKRFHEYNHSKKDRAKRESVLREIMPPIDKIISSCLTQRQYQIVLLYYKRKLTQTNIAKLLGISQSTVSQHLNGKKRNGKKIGGSFLRIRKIIHKNANSKNWPYKDKRILLALDLLRDKNITRRRAANILDSIVDTSFNSE